MSFLPSSISRCSRFLDIHEIHIYIAFSSELTFYFARIIIIIVNIIAAIVSSCFHFQNIAEVFHPGKETRPPGTWDLPGSPCFPGATRGAQAYTPRPTWARGMPPLQWREVGFYPNRERERGGEREGEQERERVTD